MSDGLDAVVVRTALDSPKSPSQPVNTLMMGAVNDHAVPVQIVQPGILGYHAAMVLVAAHIFMSLCGGEILDYAAAQPYVDDLESLADSQHGDLLCDTQVQGLKLQNVQAGVYIAGAMVAFTKKSGG